MKLLTALALRPSHAVLVASVALILALSGTGYAASSLVTQSSDTQARTSDGMNYSPSQPGSAGPKGERGPRGPRGRTGRRGRTGARGRAGAVGAQGPAGPQGVGGINGVNGAPGADGTDGAAGATGATGAIGPPGTGEFAQFFALMPPDNAATVAVGGDVDFPQDGPTSGTIVRTGADTFNVPTIGTYRVVFLVPVTEAGQLVLTLNGAELPYTVVGRATGTSAITGESLVTTTVINSIVTVRNPSSAAAALTITPVAGGASPASASIIFERLD